MSLKTLLPITQILVKLQKTELHECSMKYLLFSHIRYNKACGWVKFRDFLSVNLVVCVVSTGLLSIGSYLFLTLKICHQSSSNHSLVFSSQNNTQFILLISYRKLRY